MANSSPGVRFRAWWPACCLHPTIPPHTPLVFDLVDSWAGRSIGGCRYHVAHPGGRGHETFPVNAHGSGDAAARALRNVRPHAGTMQPFDPGPNPSFPHTLDLRRVGF